MAVLLQTRGQRRPATEGRVGNRPPGTKQKRQPHAQVTCASCPRRSAYGIVVDRWGQHERAVDEIEFHGRSKRIAPGDGVLAESATQIPESNGDVCSRQKGELVSKGSTTSPTTASTRTASAEAHWAVRRGTRLMVATRWVVFQLDRCSCRPTRPDQFVARRVGTRTQHGAPTVENVRSTNGTNAALTSRGPPIDTAPNRTRQTRLSTCASGPRVGSPDIARAGRSYGAAEGPCARVANQRDRDPEADSRSSVDNRFPRLTTAGLDTPDSRRHWRIRRTVVVGTDTVGRDICSRRTKTLSPI